MTAHDPVSSQEPLRRSRQPRPAGALLVDAQHLRVHPLAPVVVIPSGRAAFRLHHVLLPDVEGGHQPAKLLRPLVLDELDQAGVLPQIPHLLELSSQVQEVPQLHPQVRLLGFELAGEVQPFTDERGRWVVKRETFSNRRRAPALGSAHTWTPTATTLPWLAAGPAQGG